MGHTNALPAPDDDRRWPAGQNRYLTMEAKSGRLIRTGASIPRDPWLDGEFSAPPQGNTLRDYGRILWRRLPLFFGTFFLVCAAFAAATLFAKPHYEATAAIEVLTVSGSGLSLEDLFADTPLAGSGAIGNSKMATELQVAQSRTVAVETIRRAGLQAVLDQDERYYEVLARKLRRILSRVWGGVERPPLGGSVRTNPAPLLRVEVLKPYEGEEILELVVTFTGEDRFTVGGDGAGGPIAVGRLGQSVETPAFGFRITGPPPPEGTRYPLRLLPMWRALEDLRDNLQVSRNRDSNVINLRYITTQPSEAERTLACLVNVYERLKIGQKTRTASQALEFIEAQLKTLDAELRQAEGDLKHFKETHQVVSLSASAQAILNQVVALDTDRQKIETLLRQAKMVLQSLEAGGRMETDALFSLGTDLGNSVLTALATDLGKVQSQHRAMSSQYTKQHPTVVALDEQIKALQGKIKGEVTSLVATLEAQKRGLLADIKTYEGRFGELPATEQQMAQLERRTTVARDTYAFLLRKKSELEVTRASELGDMWIVDEASANPRMVKPRALLNAVVGVVLAIILGILVAIARDHFDDSIRNEEDVRAVTTLPVIGTVGVIPSAADPGGHHKSLNVVVLRDTSSLHAEAFRNMRANLLFKSVDRPRRILLATSAAPGEGKSTSISNLAAALAQAGKRVLLVDADLRRPVLHRAFGLPRVPGLTEVLVADDWEAAFRECVRPIPAADGLDVLPAGKTPPNPGELLGSHKMKLIMDKAAGLYEYVLYDCAPIGGVSDALALADRLDGIFLVVRSGKGSRTSLQHCLTILQDAPADILGVVLNAVNFTRERHYYSGYYQYYRRYGAEKQG